MESSDGPSNNHNPVPDNPNSYQCCCDGSASATNSPVKCNEETYQSFRTAIEESDISQLETALICDPKLLRVVNTFLGDLSAAEGWSALQDAAAVDFGDFNQLIRIDPERDEHNNPGMTALHLACRYGHVKVAGFLLNAGADLHAREADGCTPFHVASMYGQLEVLQLLWEQGPESQMSDENLRSNQALHLAVINKRLNVLPWLLENGADVSYRAGGDKKTALHYACQFESVEMVKLLFSHKADIHALDAFSNTPLLMACFNPHPDVFSFLRDEGALVSHLNRYGRNGFHAVILSESLSNENHQKVLKLLIGNGVDINKRDIFGFSALFHACKKGDAELIKILLDLGADINQKTTDSELTPLMEASCRPSKEPVEVLLHRGADMSPVNHHGLTAFALACAEGRLVHVETLMNNGADVAVCNRYGHRALCGAAVRGHTYIVLRVLGSQRYYPQYPADVRGSADQVLFMMNDSHDTEVEEHLLHAIEDNFSGISASLKMIMYWAVAHGRINLAKKCVSRASEVVAWTREGANWLHVAAQHAHPQLISELCVSLDASKQASGDVTPLHLAAVSGSRNTVSSLLGQIGRQAQYQSAETAKVKAILGRDSQGASPLSISIHRKYGNVTEIFWEEIRKFGILERNFMQGDSAQTSYAVSILETLAQYEKPGNEKTLKYLLEQWCTNSSLTEAEKAERLMTPLDWAVYCSQPVVVWWLLSKEGYSSDEARRNARSLVQTLEDFGIRNIMGELLQHPLPVLGNIANPNDDPLLELPQRTGINDPALMSPGTVVEVYSDGTIKSKQDPIPTIADIIYDYGPDKIMKEATDLDYWHLNALKKRIGNCHNVSHSTRRLFDSLPSAGGGQRYMKPHCIKSGNTSRNRNSHEISKGHNACTALYMPYLVLGSYEPPNKYGKLWRDDDDSAGEYEGAAAAHRSRSTAHTPMTLDQYYYPTLTDTDSRDKDQVLSKYLELKALKADRPPTTSTIPSSTDQTVKVRPISILKVDQIWMWIVDEKTIITASTEAEYRNGNPKASLLQTVLDSLIYGEKRGTFEHPTSAHSMMELILGVATGFFAKKFVPLPDNPGRVFKTPLEVFRESLRHAADEEIFLYQTFLRELNGQNRRDMWQDKSPSDHVIKDMPPHPLSSSSDPYSISPEAKVLDTIRDIRDELHMLKSLAEDQELVWKQAFKDSALEDSFQYYQFCTPEDVKKDLDDMLIEVETINNSINTLLDLRQKQASISQANDTAKQSNTIFVFTVITIVFLPLSFLSSLFALDVSSFPHESGNLKYAGWWLFPILFGASAIISLPTILLAWKVNDISEWFRTSSRGELKKDYFSDNKNKEFDGRSAQGLGYLARRAMNSRRNGSYRPWDTAEPA
ncbi:hypothetical protein ACHAP5_003173 [Fusarium lateritium]